MLIKMDADTLRAFLEANDDCSALSQSEYVVDLYDAPVPMTLDIELAKDGVRVAAAAKLLYDRELDGWYMGDRLDDENLIRLALESAINADKSR